MDRIKSTTNNFLRSVLAFSLFCTFSAKAQTPAKCLEIESVLADACNQTSTESNNEMVRFKVGPSAMNINNLTVDGAGQTGVFQNGKWPSGSTFLGFVQNATTANATAALQATVQSPCGFLLEPPAGMVPAGSEVLIITSFNVSTVDNSFATLVGTLYVIYQNGQPGTAAFANSGAGTRTLVLKDNVLGCSDTVMYSPNSLVGGNGATINYTWPGTAIETYINSGCKAPLVQNTANAGTAPASICQGVSVNLTGTATGSYSSVIWQAASGVFSAPNSLTTSYTPAISSGSITVSFGVIDFCNDTVFSTVVINVTAPPVAPIVTSPVMYCQTATASALTATGSNLLWYVAASGGVGSAIAPTPSTVSIGTTSFFVSQTISGCESTRSQIDVTITAAPVAPTVTSPVAYCQNATASALTATGSNLLWYTASSGGVGSATAITPSTTTAGTISYYVSQTTNGCESARSQIDVTVTASPSAPTVTSPVGYCENATALALVATGSNLLWYVASSGGVGSATTPTVSTATAGTTSYFVSQTTNGCESPRSQINVTITAPPSAPVVISPVAYCQNATSSSLTATGSNLLWYTASSGGVGSSVTPTVSTSSAGQTDFYVSQTVSGCESPRATIAVTVNATPVMPTVISPITYCQNTTPAALSASGVAGNSLLWYTASSGGVSSSTMPTVSTVTAGVTNYYVSQQTVSGCESPRAIISVNVNSAPVAGFSVSPNPASGEPPLVVGFTNTSQNTSASTIYNWDFGDLTNSTLQNPPSNTYNIAGTYHVTLIVSENAQCLDTAGITVVVFDNVSLIVPNVFTPNGDGKNDQFIVSAIGIKEFECKVYDRWGIKMTELQKPDTGWDGRTTSGLSASAGTYYYVITASGLDGKPYNSTGFVMLAR
jgi:gliding motility-associated-like protein